MSGQAHTLDSVRVGTGLPRDLPPISFETQDSKLYFLGDLALKVKKPVVGDGVDLSTPALRESACRREVDLNRRLAPDVYLGVGHVGTEPFVVMRRQRPEHSVAALADAGADLAEPLEAVAQVLTQFHATAARSRRISGAAAMQSVLHRWTSDTTELEHRLPPGVEPAHVSSLRQAGAAYVRGRRRLFRARIDGGHVCDGHGDLVAGDVFCPPGQAPALLDCLDVQDERRYGDVLADVAFLAVDLERHGRSAAAADLLRAYRRLSGDDWPCSLADYYVASSAVARAKAACATPELLRAAEQVQAYLDIAELHLRRARPRLVLVGGAPGSGRTTFAAALARETGWTLHSIDVLPDGPATGLGTADPSPGETPRRTGAALLTAAARDLAWGRSVILDAPWDSPSHRRAAGQVAARAEAQLVALEAVLPGVAGPSTAAVRAAWPGARIVDTTGDPAASARQLRSELLGA